MKQTRSAAAAASALVLALLLTGCGDAGASSPGLRQTPAATGTAPAVAALRPTGTAARDVSYRCTSGRDGTIVVEVPDLGDLTDRLDRMQPCEYDEGMARATLVVTCPSGPRVVHLTGTGGHLTQPSDEALCLH
jgi:hypothetical protein